MTAAARHPRLVVLAYHRVAETPRDRWGLAVSPERFGDHLRELSRRWPLRRLGDPARLGGGVAITFDDGYEDNLTAALPLLKAHEAPATCFLSGTAAGSADGFWWDRLDNALEAMGPGAPATRIHMELAAMAPGAREERLGRLPRARRSLPRRLRPGQIRELAADPLVDIGAHGSSHRAFPAMAPAVAAGEIARNLAELHAITGRRPTALAYPFGLPPADTAPLRRAGIRTAYTLGGRAVSASSDPMSLPRLQAGDWPAESLCARVERLLAPAS